MKQLGIGDKNAHNNMIAHLHLPPYTSLSMSRIIMKHNFHTEKRPTQNVISITLHMNQCYRHNDVFLKT
jgi:hypothetical protein